MSHAQAKRPSLRNTSTHSGTFEFPQPNSSLLSRIQVPTRPFHCIASASVPHCPFHHRTCIALHRIALHCPLSNLTLHSIVLYSGRVWLGEGSCRSDCYLAMTT
ncbi:hypothetical protein KC19_6G005700 [Ceratodon purpureus]|uniref:Uncharacterized protein n=1 Tax=Ceratodon purpureus TaxID=3225 RepID=A0A8T0HBG0_CERPU|nr:hypothetical protein KC19_6G005700 [Ceratodon purpureus]